MEKLNFVRDGMSRLPPGFRFQPTEEELVFQYLKGKILSWSLPASVIPEVNVCKYDPWELPVILDIFPVKILPALKVNGSNHACVAGDMEQERYFFSNKEAKYPKGNRVNRATSSGYWKATGVDKQIVSSNRKNNHNSSFQLDKWVVCRIFLKNKGTATAETTETCTNENDRGTQPRLFDFMARDEMVFDSVSSSCSSSSSPADFSSNEHDHEQSSSHSECGQNYLLILF
ncbi:hypothetical protein SADUNF_Sadunf12G0080900 [Salix dunnii]|uniref:NAC domain-containing protein n=1 Tax=Salix dunnii TaxID=1413687 RepID=A0A835MSF4_9ROSI|nr:hypothetical protein SADUNF_Sadunf12G0080900 [Salix dunnii]